MVKFNQKLPIRNVESNCSLYNKDLNIFDEVPIWGVLVLLKFKWNFKFQISSEKLGVQEPQNSEFE